MEELTDRELRRYQRQIILPGFGTEGQRAMKRSRVLVIGIGGLGTPVLQYLSAGGVGHIGMVDHDMVEESNLQRQILFGSKDLGKLKSIIARERLAPTNPDVDYEVYNLRISGDNILDMIRSYDLVVDATDNFATRYLINDACIIENKPWIYGGIAVFDGQFSVFNYQGGPTLRCLFPEVPRPGTYQDNQRSGLLGVLPGLIGCHMATEAIKVITGVGEVASGKLICINIASNDFHSYHIPVNPANRKLKKLMPAYA